jgi:hypothetical protein
MDRPQTDSDLKSDLTIMTSGPHYNCVHRYSSVANSSLSFLCVLRASVVNPAFHSMRTPKTSSRLAKRCWSAVWIVSTWSGVATAL